MITANQLAQKSFYKLQEVLDLTDVKPYVLRFWESEFEQINPVSSSHGQKLYSPKDLMIINRVKYLLIDKKLSLETAKHVMDLELEGKSAEHVLTKKEDKAQFTPEKIEAVEVAEEVMEESIEDQFCTSSLMEETIQGFEAAEVEQNSSQIFYKGNQEALYQSLMSIEQGLNAIRDQIRETRSNL